MIDVHSDSRRAATRVSRSQVGEATTASAYAVPSTIVISITMVARTTVRISEAVKAGTFQISTNEPAPSSRDWATSAIIGSPRASPKKISGGQSSHRISPRLALTCRAAVTGRRERDNAMDVVATSSYSKIDVTRAFPSPEKSDCGSNIDWYGS